MYIHVENRSEGLVRYKDIAPAIHAINRQIREHFMPLWGRSAYVTYQKNSDYSPNVTFDVILFITKQPTTRINNYDTKDSMHTMVCVEEATKQGVPFSVLLAHEILETIIDPIGNKFAVGSQYLTHSKPAIYPLGMCCSPVQLQWYEIDGVKLPNFVTPIYFSNYAVTNLTTFLDTKLEPFCIAPGGRIIYFDPIERCVSVKVEPDINGRLPYWYGAGASGIGSQGRMRMDRCWQTLESFNAICK